MASQQTQAPRGTMAPDSIAATADTQPPEQAKPTTPAQPPANTCTNPDPPNSDPNPYSQSPPNFSSDTDSDSDSDSDTSLAFANLLTTNKLMAEALRAGKHTHTPTHQHQPPPPPATTDTIPTSLFFYGTLQDPTVLQSVTKLTPPLPALQDAHLKGGFDLRLWGGKYPVLVPNPESEAVIRGKLWRVGEAEDRFGAEEWERLRRYETAAYDFVECVVRVGVEDEGDGEGVRAVVFKWAGDGESAELSEGVFDLDVWREKFGGVVFG